MVTVSKILGSLDPYKGQTVKIVADQNTDDIIDGICSAHLKYQDQYKKIAPFFLGRNNKETAKNIYDFLKDNVKYKIESGNRQTIKSPAAIVAEGYNIGGDCKHYALFSGGVLAQLGIPFAYRFASYKLLDKIPGHVFVVVNPKTKNEIWIDPVLSFFNYKKPYTYSIDKKMALYSISGVNPTKTEKKAARKAAGKTLGQKIKKGAKVVLKVAGAPARAAFLGLVDINFANLAKKYSLAWQKDPSKVRIHWEQIGGKIESLKKAWEKGENKKRIFGDDSIGFAPGAAVAAAAPIIAKASEFLKSIGIDPAELVQIGKDALNNKAQMLAAKALTPKAEKQAEEIEIADVVTEDNKDLSNQGSQKELSKKFILPLAIGGAAILYFVTKKK